MFGFTKWTNLNEKEHADNWCRWVVLDGLQSWSGIQMWFKNQSTIYETGHNW